MQWIQDKDGNPTDFLNEYEIDAEYEDVLDETEDDTKSFKYACLCLSALVCLGIFVAVAGITAS